MSFSEIRLEEVTVMVAVAPDDSDPDVGETESPDTSEIEKLTGPPLAVRVNVPVP